MAANWTSFKSNLKNHFEGNKTSPKVWTVLANEYDKAIKSATDLVFMNSIGSTNKSGMEQILKAGFLACEKLTIPGAAKPIMKTTIAGATTVYWLGATLKPLIPPPGSISVVSNVVLFPGIPPVVEWPDPSDDPAFLGNYLSNIWAAQLLTISGVTTAMTYIGTATIPIPYPWLGIK